MRILIEVLSSIVAVWVATAICLLVWLRRYNRVSLRARSRAPLSWLVSPRRAAVAHRRLRRAVGGARVAAGLQRGSGRRSGSSSLSGCVIELERHAATVDDHLVLAARCSPAVRRSLVSGLGREVGEVERLAARVTSAAIGRSSGGSPARLDDVIGRIGDHLDALEAARADLAALEATWASPAFEPRRSPRPSA